MAIYEKRWFMWDYARLRRFDREEFLLVADKLKALGYNGIGLYLEGAFDFNCFDGILRDGVMTREDAKWAKAECEKRGLFLFPMTNVVGHMEHFLRQERFKKMKLSQASPKYDIAFQTPEAEELAMKIIYDYLDAFEIKYIHIGGDEVKVTDENKPIYAKFLARLCDKLLSEGIKPAIWNDMLWAHKELCEPFSREVELFDWHYCGHRKESTEYFVEQGFKKVYVCPSENSWIGFIGQSYSAFRFDADREPVTHYEIEAFLSDGAELENYKERSALITNWEGTQGRDLWGQWSALARAGLYMTGDLKNREENDELIERAIFGLFPPYTQMLRTIKTETHIPLLELVKKNLPKASVNYTSSIRAALFIPSYFKDVMISASNKSFFDYELIGKVIDKCSDLLQSWTPEGAFEERCYNSIASVISLMRAAFALHKAAADCGKYYSVAAEKQFSASEEAKRLIIEFAKGFRAAKEKAVAYRADLARLIDCTGHTPTDLARIDIIMGFMDGIADYLESLVISDRFCLIPLPSFDGVVKWIAERELIESVQ